MAIVTTRRMEQAIRDSQQPQHPRRLMLGNSTDYSVFQFGFSQVGNIVTVNSGIVFYRWIKYDGSGHISEDLWNTIPVSETDIEITQDINVTMIYVEILFTNPATCTIKGFLGSGGGMGPTVIWWPLSYWQYINERTTLYRIAHLGDIIIPCAISQ